MTQQVRLSGHLADYLTTLTPEQAAPIVAHILRILGWHPDEVRMWGLNVPTEEA